MVRVDSEVRRRETEIQKWAHVSRGFSGLGGRWTGRVDWNSCRERLEEAAAVVKATTTATGNKNKYRIPMENRRMATATVKLRNPVLQDPRKKTRKA